VERRQLLHCYLAGLFIGSKYGNSTFLWNVGERPQGYYKALHLTK
jgi:hypothetical protein